MADILVTYPGLFKNEPLFDECENELYSSVNRGRFWLDRTDIAIVTARREKLVNTTLNTLIDKVAIEGDENSLRYTNKETRARMFELKNH